jgi:putative transposase
MRGIADQASAATKTARRQRARQPRNEATSAMPASGVGCVAKLKPLPADRRVFANVEEWT